MKLTRQLAMHLAKLIAVTLLGGLLGAMLVRAAPGFGVDEQELDNRLNHKSMQALRHANGTDQALGPYCLHVLQRMIHGDLGTSATLQQPVRQLLAERMPETLKTVGMGLLLAWSLGLAMVAMPQLVRSGPMDLLTSALAGVLLCLPAAVLALLSVMAHAPGQIVIGLVVFPKIFHYTRNLLQHSAAQPHVLTAWAKGLGSGRILLRHTLPPIAPQLFALGGVSLSLAFAAAIPVEVVCDLPGIGQLAWKAAMGRDLALLVSLTMLVTLMTLVANSIASLTGGGLRAEASA